MISVEATSALIDAPLIIRLTGLTPKSRVTLLMKATDAENAVWSSFATFIVSNKGIVDLSEQAPIKGSYSGLDAMGLFWSMKPEQDDQPEQLFKPDLKKTFNLTLSASTNEKSFSEEIIHRKILAPDVTVYDINEDGVVGRCFAPTREGKRPAILICGGSSGGIASQEAAAALLASHGYVTLALAYFNYEHLPKTLYEIPLETFQRGIKWLKSRSYVDENRIVMMGTSKGAEAVLAATSHLPMKINGVIAAVPSNVVWQGVGHGKPESRSSWTLKGKPLPFVKLHTVKVLPQLALSKLVKLFHLERVFRQLTRTRFRPLYDNFTTAKASEIIPVENIQAPLLLLSCADDQVWPSTDMSQEILIRRRENECKYKDDIVIFPNAGHLLRIPNLPSTVSWVVTPARHFIVEFGGTPQANARASVESWKKILTFLKMHL